MDDLISRQAAIDAILGQPPEPHYPSWYAEQIKNLPPAQPEQRSFSCSQENDLISRQEAIDILMELVTNGTNKGMIFGEDALHRVEVLPSAQQWTPIKWHDCTDEDREKYGFSNDIVAVFDCEMPDDGESILVTTSHGYVCQDMCYIDDGYSLDSGYDWIDDITAWMPLPEPYEGREE